jgi:cobalamin biosynthesis Mg chelatase CobN
MQSPTSDGGLSGTSPEKVWVGGDPATGAGTETGLDGSQEYTLSFDGEPHAQQGYHVKLTVHTPYSHGADTKHKVYWVEGCEEAAPGEDNEVDEETDDNEEEQGPAEESHTQAEDADTEVRGAQASDDIEVLGAQASTQDSSGTQVAGRQAGASAAVPTSVEAGMSDTERLRSVLPALAVLLGLATIGAILLHRRHMRS